MISLHRFKHHVRARPRLITATITGLICFILLPAKFSLLTRGIISWNLLAWVYLIFLWVLMLQANPKHIRRIACIQDESASLVLMMVCIGSVVSLLVIFFELTTAKQHTGFIQAQHIALTFSTLTASWMLVPTAFAIHYAHLFYLAPEANKPFLFPDRPSEPSYWDFIYFSFTIAVASQTADVAVCGTSVRRIVLLQSFLSFIFNISILGLFVNVSASLLS